MARRKTTLKVEPETTIEEPKADASIEVEKPRPRPEPEPKPEEPTPRRKRYVATKVTLWHPFQRAKIYAGSPGTLLDEDSWLLSQMERGLVREV